MAVLTGTSAKNRLSGTGSRDTLSGLAGDDTLLGLAGSDLLLGGAGNDTLDGGTGTDTLDGGAGNDIYLVDAALDKVLESASQGTDLIKSSVSYTLPGNVEQLTLLGSAALNATGNTLANWLTGNAGNNRLNGGVGADSMVGGAGNDTYVVDNTGDRITESTGVDTVEATISYQLANGLERLVLMGSASTNGTGNTLDNVITGNAGNNTLDGGAGADLLIGGAGNDRYLVDNAGDLITEFANQGTDTVISSVSCTLSANVEQLTLTGSANLNGTGNADANLITGNTGNNTLDGGAGADTLIGGSGNDTLIYDTADATVDGGSGTDRLRLSSAAPSLDLGTSTALRSIEIIDLGASGSLNLTDAQLRALSDTDFLQVDGSGTASVSATGGFWTLVGTFGDYTRYTLNGATLNVASTLDQHLIRQNAAPQAITDSLSTNEDTALLFHTSDLLTNDLDPDNPGAGQILSVVGFGQAGHGAVIDHGDGSYTYTPALNYHGDDSFTYSLSDGAGGIVMGTVNVTIAPANDAPTGAPGISGVAAVGQVLSAVAGTLADADGLGAFTYQWQRSSDGVNDWIDLTNETHADYTASLTDAAAFLRVVVSYVDGDGSAETVNSATSARVTGATDGADTLTGTADNDYINALAGNDEVYGLAGDDTLEGAAGDDTLDAGNGNDTLDGGAGADTLIGGDGDDLLVVDDRGDVVLDTLGTDTVQASISYALDLTLENLTLTGSEPLDGTGNSLVNLIIGNAGNNTLDGGAGDDTLSGGAGNDTLNGGADNDTASYDGAGAGVSVALAAGMWLRYCFNTDALVYSNPGLDPASTLPAGLTGGGAWSTQDGTPLEALGLKGQSVTDTAIAASSWHDGNAFVFSLTVADGYALDLSSIAFWEQGSSGGRGFGPTNWSLSANGVSLGSGAAQRGNPGAVHLLDLGAPTALSGTVNFTLAATGATDSATGANNAAGATWRVDNFTLTGSVHPTQATAQDTGGAGSDLLIDIEHLTGSAYADTLTGDATNNTLIGGAGNDVLTGLGGTDYLLGGVDADTLDGDAGNDTLQGDAGNDVLEGGDGNDTLSGGAGEDSFRFNAMLGAGNVDIVSDFEGAGATGGDVLMLDHDWFLGMSAGALAGDAFETATAATAFTTRILYDAATGNLFFDQDGSLTTFSPVQFATLSTHPTGLATGDFLVV